MEQSSDTYNSFTEYEVFRSKNNTPFKSVNRSLYKSTYKQCQIATLQETPKRVPGLYKSRQVKQHLQQNFTLSSEDSSDANELDVTPEAYGPQKLSQSDDSISVDYTLLPGGVPGPNCGYIEPEEFSQDSQRSVTPTFRTTPLKRVIGNQGSRTSTQRVHTFSELISEDTQYTGAQPKVPFYQGELSQYSDIEFETSQVRKKGSESEECSEASQSLLSPRILSLSPQILSQRILSSEKARPDYKTFFQTLLPVDVERKGKQSTQMRKVMYNIPQEA